MKKLFLILLATLLLQSCTTETDQVTVVSHRADWRNYPENSIEAIKGSIAMGVDMIEIDVAKTKDGVLILMHDQTIDRTTNGKGSPSDYTLEEIEKFYLRNGMGRVTSTFKIPTLEEAMLTAKGKVKVNLDKADKYFDDVYALLKRTGTLNQTVIKSNKPYSTLLSQFGDKLKDMEFMPILTIDRKTTLESIKPLLDERYSMYEICFKEENTELFKQIQKEFEGSDSKIWINSLWPSLCGGYSDNKSYEDPTKGWGYLIDTLGARVLQTDRPAQLIEYLRSRGMHK